MARAWLNFWVVRKVLLTKHPRLRWSCKKWIKASESEKSWPIVQSLWNRKCWSSLCLCQRLLTFILLCVLSMILSSGTRLLRTTPTALKIQAWRWCQGRHSRRWFGCGKQRRRGEQVAVVGRNADLFNLESLCYVNPATQWLVFSPTNAQYAFLQPHVLTSTCCSSYHPCLIRHTRHHIAHLSLIPSITLIDHQWSNVEKYWW